MLFHDHIVRQRNASVALRDRNIVKEMDIMGSQAGDLTLRQIHGASLILKKLRNGLRRHYGHTRGHLTYTSSQADHTDFSHGQSD